MQVVFGHFSLWNNDKSLVIEVSSRSLNRIQFLIRYGYSNFISSKSFLMSMWLKKIGGKRGEWTYSKSNYATS